MARPKTGKPTKQRINLTVTAEVRNYLNQLSQIKKMSISEIVSKYAEREIKKLHKQQNDTVTVPDNSQNEENLDDYFSLLQNELESYI